MNVTKFNLVQFIVYYCIFQIERYGTNIFEIRYNRLWSLSFLNRCCTDS